MFWKWDWYCYNPRITEREWDTHMKKIVTATPMVKPFLKWAGGKFRVVDRLKKHFPKGTRFVEPFLGAGAVCLNVDYPEFIVADTNADLIAVWKSLKDDGMDFVKSCKKLFCEENNKREVFDAFKKEFNTTKDVARKAELFLYLNRHGFNGLCRYNGDGEYNVPFGKNPAPYFPQDEFEKCLEKVKTFKILNKDFRKVFELVESGDVVYCDPPYLPMSQSASFDGYSTGGFSLQDQIDLAKCASDAADKGATVVITNNYNWYTRQIYKRMFGGAVYKIDVARTISSKIDERNAVEEIIAVFNKENAAKAARDVIRFVA